MPLRCRCFWENDGYFKRRSKGLLDLAKLEIVLFDKMEEETTQPLKNDSSQSGASGKQPGFFKRFLKQHQKALYICLLVAAVGGIVSITFLIDRPDDFEEYIESSGYVGVFLMALVGSSSPVWPLPGSWAVFIAAGLGLNPALLALIAGIGEPIGESTAYMAGYGGQVVVTNLKGYDKVERWMLRRGGIIIFLVSAIPNVLIKAAVVCAGALKYPFLRFFIFCWTGKTIKSLFFAISGYYFFDTLFDLFDRMF